MSSVFATKEKQPLVPKTPDNAAHLRSELKELAQTLNVVSTLRSYQFMLEVVRQAATAPADAHYYVLSLEQARSERPRIFIWTFKKSELKEAEEKEQELLGDSARDVVLVAVDSVDALYKAYPNYFADTTLFIQAVNEVLDR